MFANCKSLREATSDGSEPDIGGHSTSLEQAGASDSALLSGQGLCRRPAETIAQRTREKGCHNQPCFLTSAGSWGAPGERSGWLGRGVGGLPEASVVGQGRGKGCSERRGFLSGERLAATCQEAEIS